jgi:hypothetical protein
MPTSVEAGMLAAAAVSTAAAAVAVTVAGADTAK